jgi:hypothetical protein
MKTYYYYKSLRKTIIQFLDIFNDIRIARYAPDGSTIRSYLNVPLKLGTKQKVWYWINERKDDEVLPIMSATMQAVDFASDRQVNKQAKIIKTTTVDQKTVSRFLNPTPYNFTFQLSVWALYMVDIDQILEQILPYFNPYVMTKINIPELDATMDIKVLFQSASPDVTFELPDEERRKLLWNLDFLVQGYLFQPVSDSGIAEQIITNFYLDDDRFNARSTETLFATGAPVSGAVETLWQMGEDYDAEGEVLLQYEIFRDWTEQTTETGKVITETIVPNDDYINSYWAPTVPPDHYTFIADYGTPTQDNIGVSATYYDAEEGWEFETPTGGTRITDITLYLRARTNNAPTTGKIRATLLNGTTQIGANWDFETSNTGTYAEYTNIWSNVDIMIANADNLRVLLTNGHVASGNHLLSVSACKIIVTWENPEYS